jgi:hypothetical protein
MDKEMGKEPLPLTPHIHEREKGEEIIPGEPLPLTPHRKEYTED